MDIAADEPLPPPAPAPEPPVHPAPARSFGPTRGTLRLSAVAPFVHASILLSVYQKPAFLSTGSSRPRPNALISGVCRTRPASRPNRARRTSVVGSPRPCPASPRGGTPGLPRTAGALAAAGLHWRASDRLDFQARRVSGQPSHVCSAIRPDARGWGPKSRRASVKRQEGLGNPKALLCGGRPLGTARAMAGMRCGISREGAVRCRRRFQRFSSRPLPSGCPYGFDPQTVPPKGGGILKHLDRSALPTTSPPEPTLPGCSKPSVVRGQAEKTGSLEGFEASALSGPQGTRSIFLQPFCWSSQKTSREAVDWP
jgi:hypothetical protein